MTRGLRIVQEAASAAVRAFGPKKRPPLVDSTRTIGSLTIEQLLSILKIFRIETVGDLERLAAKIEPVTDISSSYSVDEKAIENLAKPVYELESSVRAANGLQNANIHYVYELVQRTEAELLKTKNFGRKSLIEIKTVLAEMGLTPGMEFDNITLLKVSLKTGKINSELFDPLIAQIQVELLNLTFAASGNLTQPFSYPDGTPWNVQTGDKAIRELLKLLGYEITAPAQK